MGKLSTGYMQQTFSLNNHLTVQASGRSGGDLTSHLKEAEVAAGRPGEGQARAQDAVSGEVSIVST